MNPIAIFLESCDHRDPNLTDPPYMARNSFCHAQFSSSTALALIGLSLLASGCSHQRNQTLNPEGPILAPEQGTQPTTLAAYESSMPNSSHSSSRLLSEIMLLLIDSQSHSSTHQIQSATSPGPELIAGDWLAWQCAIAGNYWNLETKNAPVYAGAIDSSLDD